MPRRPITSEHASVVVTLPKVGCWVGRYRLCLELASGGMSTVYLARVRGGVGAHRFVALKFLKPQLASDPGFVEMFLDEARLASLIDHPNVCSVLDYRIEDGISFLAMDYLAGQSLSAIGRQLRIQSDVIAPAQLAGLVARIIADAAEGLHAAHELTDLGGRSLGVVHRDVSPENVFVTYDGNVKIMDFGIAATKQQQHHTEPGQVRGKYSYVAPELLRGRPPTRRSDVWGLGVIAWELIAGRPLFGSDADVETLRAVVDMPIPRPSEERPGLPRDLDDIVLSALQRDPAHRIPTTRELGRKLHCFLAEQHLPVGLADISDLMDRLYPNGRACARQILDVVSRMEDDLATDDADGDRPTVAQLLPSRDIFPLATPPQPQQPASTPTPTASVAAAPARWSWMVFPPTVALLIVAAGLFLRGCPRPDHQSAAAAPAPAQTQDLVLQPVITPDGETLYRVRSPGM